MTVTPCKQKQFSQSNHHCNWAPQIHVWTFFILHHRITIYCAFISPPNCTVYGAREEENCASCQTGSSSHLLTGSTAQRHRPWLRSQAGREARRRESCPFHPWSSLSLGRNSIMSATAFAKRNPRDAVQKSDYLWLRGTCKQHRLPNPPEHLFLMVFHLPQQGLLLRLFILLLRHLFELLWQKAETRKSWSTTAAPCNSRAPAPAREWIKGRSTPSTNKHPTAGAPRRHPLTPAAPLRPGAKAAHRSGPRPGASPGCGRGGGGTSPSRRRWAPWGRWAAPGSPGCPGRQRTGQRGPRRAPPARPGGSPRESAAAPQPCRGVPPRRAGGGTCTAALISRSNLTISWWQTRTGTPAAAAILGGEGRRRPSRRRPARGRPPAGERREAPAPASCRPRRRATRGLGWGGGRGWRTASGRCGPRLAVLGRRRRRAFPRCSQR